ncbi:sodium-dependent phosphate transporter [Achlya hypogyna]|uniref:Sodium-dependent phosphate transporter n=1 Tax=Achlya hypogyna TaxID=1202772 RepID=A0A1V9ZUR7_ACHHY|nr:sodium-dependent phosphate transporter [Achlya hypogyna]
MDRRVKLFDEYDPWTSPVQRESEADAEPLGSVQLVPAPSRPCASTLGLVLILLTGLYLFMVSIRWLADGFVLTIACHAKDVFAFTDEALCGFVVGLVTAALLNSCNTVIAITVACVGAGAMTDSQAVPIVIGANVGTCVTCLLVAFAQVHARDQFRRAVAAASLHALFNLAAAAVFFPLEAAFHPLERLAVAVTGEGAMPVSSLFDSLTAPAADLWVCLDKARVAAVLDGEACGPLVRSGAVAGLSNASAGAASLALGLVALVLALASMVSACMRLGRTAAAGLLPRLVGVHPAATVLLGAVATLALHSSTVMTSTLAPLAGLNVLSLEQALPLVVGANLGATGPGLLAAAVAGQKCGAHVALVNVWFNAFGAVLLYVLPPPRRVLLRAAAALGTIAGQWPTAVVLFVTATFLVGPLLLVGVDFVFDASVVAGVLLTLVLAAAGFYTSVWYHARGGRACWERFLAAKAASTEAPRDVFFDDEP